jgi:hypothetical protein
LWHIIALKGTYVLFFGGVAFDVEKINYENYDWSVSR